MPYSDIEVGIQESPIKTEEMMYDLMCATSALSTSKSLSAHSKVRSVLIDLIGLGMVVVPLYISKIIESLNKVSDKLNKVYSDSEYIKLRLIEIFNACEEQTRKCPNGQIKHSVGKYIVSLSHGILSDITTCDKETKIRNLVINSFMWKSPHYTKYLDRSFVNDKSSLIKSMLSC